MVETSRHVPAGVNGGAGKFNRLELAPHMWGCKGRRAIRRLVTDCHESMLYAEHDS